MLLEEATLIFGDSHHELGKFLWLQSISSLVNRTLPVFINPAQH
jgi:hypothetical protein